MSDKFEKPDQPDRLEKQPLKAPDAQEARVAGASDLASVERKRTNASDGSLRRYSYKNSMRN